MMAPRASQTLVDAVIGGRTNTHAVWNAWLVFVGVYAVFAVLRNTAMRFWNPLATRTMSEMTAEAFARVQSLLGRLARRHLCRRHGAAPDPRHVGL